MTQHLALNTAQEIPIDPVNDYDIRGGGGIILRARECRDP